MNPTANTNQGIYLLASYGVGNQKYSFKTLLDCGAESSLMSEDMLHKIPVSVRPQPQVQKTCKKLRMADGSTTICAKIIKMPLSLNGQRHVIEFIVGKFSDDAMVGMKDLQAIGMAIDLNCLKYLLINLNAKRIKDELNEYRSRTLLRGNCYEAATSINI